MKTREGLIAGGVFVLVLLLGAITACLLGTFLYPHSIWCTGIAIGLGVSLGSVGTRWVIDLIEYKKRG